MPLEKKGTREETVRKIEAKPEDYCFSSPKEKHALKWQPRRTVTTLVYVIEGLNYKNESYCREDGDLETEKNKLFNFVEIIGFPNFSFIFRIIDAFVL